MLQIFIIMQLDNTIRVSETATLMVVVQVLVYHAAKKVIKKIVSNTDLTSGANFGLMEWGTMTQELELNISDNGARKFIQM